MRKLAALATILAVVAAVPAVAQQPVTLQDAESALADAWEAAPLSFRNVQLVTDAPAYGVYAERPDNRFKAGEPVIIYLEPVGYGYTGDAEGYKFGLRFDLAVKDGAGRTLVDQKDLTEVELSSKSQNREFPVKLTINLSETVPGDYTLDFVAHDISSSKTGSFGVAMSITE